MQMTDKIQTDNHFDHELNELRNFINKYGKVSHIFIYIFSSVFLLVDIIFVAYEH